MDLSSLLVLAAIAVGAWFAPRVLFESVGRAGEGMAALFVPPDRSLGWPHGVQESDAPWGWRAGTPTNAGRAAADDGTVDDFWNPGLFEVEEAGIGDPGAGGGLVIGLQRVTRD